MAAQAGNVFLIMSFALDLRQQLLVQGYTGVVHSARCPAREDAGKREATSRVAIMNSTERVSQASGPDGAELSERG